MTVYVRHEGDLIRPNAIGLQWVGGPLVYVRWKDKRLRVRLRFYIPSGWAPSFSWEFRQNG